MPGPGTSPVRPRERGAAFILVLAVLLALLTLAGPLIYDATQQNVASTAHMARAEARAYAGAMARYARERLVAGHRAEEALRAEDRGGAPDNGEAPRLDTPEVDLPEEFRVAARLEDAAGMPLRDDEGHPLLHFADPRGVLVDLKVRDEQSYPNLLTAPPFLIAAVLGRTVLADDLGRDDTEIRVEDGSAFPEEQGYLLIDGEVVFYQQRVGNLFTGCRRGLPEGLQARGHREDAWVLDDRARRVAMLPFREQPPYGELPSPAAATYVKRLVSGQGPALTLEEVERLVERFSIHGRGFVAGGFGPPVTLERDFDPEEFMVEGRKDAALLVSSVQGCGSGTVVRITDGVNTEYRMVGANRAGGFRGGSGVLVLMEPPRNAYRRGATTVAPLLRHPVNVNAAPREVLVQIMEGLKTGLMGRSRGTLGRVGGTAAGIAADAMISARPVTGFKHLRLILEEARTTHPLVFTTLHAHAIYRNAVNPGDLSLSTSTVPFSFRSFDHYEISSAASVNDGAGMELARHRVREWVSLAPPGPLVRSLDTQADFEQPILRWWGARWTTTHPLPVARFMPFDAGVPYDRIPRMLHRFGSELDVLAAAGGGREREREEQADRISAEDGLFPDPETGDVRLLPARMPASGYVQHFDGPAGLLRDPQVPLDRIDPEGWLLDRGPFRFEAASRGGGRRRSTRRGRGSGGGSLVDRYAANPVRVDLWYQTDRSTGGRRVIFDLVGTDPEEDRIQLVLEGDGALRARVSGRTLDDPGDGFEEVAETLWYPQAGGFWQAFTWYHLGMAYRGTKPEDVSILVDGFKRGRSRYLTRLAGAVTADDTGFAVEDAEFWPQRGVARVGSEVISFERNGNSFEVVQLNGQPWGRGRRGTRAMAHPSGTPVSLFGYSTPPRTVDGRTGVVIPRGGGTLASNLGPMAVATFASNDQVSINVGGGPPGGPGTSVTLEVHDPAEPGGDVLDLVETSRGPGGLDAFPAAGGYVLIVSLSVTGFQGGGLEFAHYEQRSGNRLMGLSSVSPPNPSLGGGGGPQISVTRMVHPVRLVGMGTVPDQEPLACVFPLSIPVTDATGYAQPVSARGSTYDTWPEFVQVGQPDLVRLQEHDVEWIRYHHVDVVGGHLLCDEAAFLQSSGQALQTLYLGSGSIAGAHTVLRGTLPMREQCGTAALTDGRHLQGGDVVPCIRTVSHTRAAAINAPNVAVSGGSGTGATFPEAPVNGQRWSAAGWGDRVTIEEPNGAGRTRARVSWAGLDQRFQLQGLGGGGPGGGGGGAGGPTLPPDYTRYPGHGWIAFDRSPGREFRQRRRLPRDGRTENRTAYVRLLKFPSGELPFIGRGAEAAAGGAVDGIGAAGGRIDELRVADFEPDRYVVWDHGVLDLSAPDPGATSVAVDSGAEEVPIANVRWLFSNGGRGGARRYVLPDGREIRYEEEVRGLPRNTGGLVRIDEEIIAFREIGTGTGGAPALLNCQRGFMDTLAEEHGYGADVVFLEFIPVTMLEGGASPEDWELAVTGMRGFAREGTLLVNREMIHYTSISQNRFLMPPLRDAQRREVGGLLRGRYGTRPQAHGPESIVMEMPFRYWDRYAEREDSSEMSWYGLSLDLPGAFFQRIAFDEYRPGPATDIVVLARTQGDVPWYADPGTPGLFRFEESKEDLPARIMSTGTRLDVRVMFRYLSGALEPETMMQHDWKRTPELRALSVHYMRDPQVLARESGR